MPVLKPHSAPRSATTSSWCFVSPPVGLILNVVGVIARIDPSIGGQAQLQWCTFYGGNNDDVIYGVKIGPAGEIAFVGRTLSNNLPTTPGALRSFYTASGDAFVGTLSGDGTALLYSTYLGGTGSEGNMMGLNTDQNNDVYIFGYSGSSDFPVSGLPNTPLQTTNLGSNDKTFTKINSDLSSLVFSTYYGGSNVGNYPGVMAENRESHEKRGTAHRFIIEGAHPRVTSSIQRLAARMLTGRTCRTTRRA